MSVVKKGFISAPTTVRCGLLTFLHERREIVIIQTRLLGLRLPFFDCYQVVVDKKGFALTELCFP